MTATEKALLNARFALPCSTCFSTATDAERASDIALLIPDLQVNFIGTCHTCGKYKVTFV